MKRTKQVIFIALILFSFSPLAATCRNLQECVNLASKLTNKSYVHMEKFTGEKVNLSGVDLNAENIDFYLSYLFNQKGFTRVLHKDQNRYIVVNARDVRYTPTFVYEDLTTIPDTYDYAMAVLPIKKTTAKQVVRSFRPFMSRYGRIMPMENSRSVLIQDTALNIKRMIKLIKMTDREQIELSKEEKRERRETTNFNRKLRLLEAKSCAKKS